MHDISNENGEMVANYAINNDMFLTSTNFNNMRKSILECGHPLIIKQQIKLTTLWLAKKKMRLIHDARSKRGYNCDSDHFLVHIKIKQKLIPVKTKQIQKHKWDRQLLNQREKINKYQENIQTKLQEIE